ncbi:MAG: hypothetical protein A6F71_09715 [Cycloclasticus sp. symbiont of Poecilosclerida sp. M]|nr:MAG: hypothetical protein A6F71_09715 [Cycloclasticus sp. symbiont of Poecilosclerida sp. M]
MEVDRPEYTEIKFSELSDYPPRIVIDLTPTEQASAPAVLNVMGFKDDCCFRIANDCVPSMLIHVHNIIQILLSYLARAAGRF